MPEISIEQQIQMLYPTFNFISQRGSILPSINLPLDYKDRARRFNEQQRRKDLENYVIEIKDAIKDTPFDADIRLGWDEENPGLLRYISSGIGGGLDLNDRMGWPSYQEHNLGTNTGFVAAVIATQYISELLKS